jgi:hypothetical protein
VQGCRGDSQQRMPITLSQGMPGVQGCRGARGDSQKTEETLS